MNTEMIPQPLDTGADSHFHAAASAPIRVVLVDDYEMLRAGLRVLIESWPGFEVVAEAATPRLALSLIPALRPGIILVDLDRYLDNGDLSAIQDLLANAGGAKIVILTGLSDEKLHQRVVLAGIKGVVLKSKAAGELHRACECCHRGELWISRSLAASLVAEMSHAQERKAISSEQAMLETLTRREREIAAVVCEGLKNQEIGERLLISETTVRHHLSSIFAKLNVASRFELVVFLCRNKFIDLSSPVSALQ